MNGAADSILETLDALDVEQFIIVGHSMGGGLAIVVADRAPRRVVGIGLISAAGFWGRGNGAVSAHTELLHSLWRGAVRVSGPVVLHIPALRERVFGAFVAEPSNIDARLARMFSRDVARARSSVAARAALFSADLMPVAAGLDMPAQLVWGAQDRLVPVSVGRQLRARMRDAQLGVLDHVGHLPIWEDPDATSAALVRLVERTRPRTR